MLEINDADLTVLNKFKVNINNDDKRLLALGLNFVPTPCWTEKIETTEWLNLLHHIRRIEWSYVFNDCDHNKFCNLENLKLLSFPDQESKTLTKNYCIHANDYYVKTKKSERKSN